MAIDLTITWRDGHTEFPCGVGMRSAQEWARIAGQLGLPMLARFDGGLVPFDAFSLDALVAEFARLRDHFVAEELARGATAEGRWSESVGRFIEEISRLRNRDGWVGNLG